MATKRRTSESPTFHSVSVDLLPDSLRWLQARRRRIRSWTLLAVATALMSAVPLGIEGFHQRRLKGLKFENVSLTREIESERERLNLLVHTTNEYADQIARANALHGKRSWSGMMILLANALPAEVWLQTVSSETPTVYGSGTTKPPVPPTQRDSKSGQTSGGVAGASSNAPEAVVHLEGPRRIIVEGFALEHSNIYEFMSGLREWGAFERVELSKAGSEPFQRGTAIRFKVECTW